MRVVFWLRSLLATANLIVVTAIVAALVLIMAPISRRAVDNLIWFWAVALVWAFNIDIHLSGEENLPQSGCLFLFNHSSHFDIIVFCASIRKSARFGAKIELFKIPIFGAAMRASGVLPIHRAEKERVFQLYAESAKRVHAGESFVLAAEGTRQPTPGIGAKFKTGPFVFALSGQFPIVPVVIRGAAECLPKNQLIACTDQWRHRVSVQILPPIPTTGFSLENREDLQTLARSKMVEAYDRAP